MATKLASGYIDLTVKYSSAMQKIGSDFAGLENDAERAGERAGRALGEGLQDGASDGAKKAGRRVQQDLTESAAGRATGMFIGRTVGEGIRTTLPGSARGALQEFGQIAQRDGNAAAAGTFLGRAMGNAIKLSLIGTAGTATAALGYTLMKGFQRLEKIDTARSKLLALGNTAGDVDKIMQSATDAVKGTAFSLDQAAAAAAASVAAGLKPGEELTNYLSTIADTAAIAGTSFEDMASIFNKVTSNNKAYTDDLQQLADRGVPIFQYLQRQYGVTGDALAKMVQDGKVNAADFARALESNIDGAAQNMGQSFSGAIDNMQTAIARVGANFLATIFGGDQATALSGPTDAVNAITEKLDEFNAWITEHRPEVLEFFTDVATAAISAAQDVVTGMGEIIGAVADAFDAAGSVGDFFGVDNDFSATADSLEGISQSLLNTGESFDAAKARVQQWGDTAVQEAQDAQNAMVTVGDSVKALPFKHDIDIHVNQTGTDIVGVGAAIDALPFKKTVQIDMQLTASGEKTVTAQGVPSFDGVTPAPWLLDAFGYDPSMQPRWQSGPVTNPPGRNVGPLPTGGTPVTPSIFGPGTSAPGRGSATGNAFDSGFFLPSTGGPGASRSPLDDLLGSGNGGEGAGLAFALANQKQSYGLAAVTDTGGYGTGTGDTFPPWVMQLANYFGIKPSTYAGHQETNRNEAGYAANPNHENRGIDWSGSPQNMQRFADYLATIPQDLEQVIWNGGGIGTGKTVEIAGGRSQPGYFAGDLAGHGNHVHTRQSMPIPLPPELLRGTHDQGGWWDPNQLALNRTGEPELVLNPEQAQSYMRVMDMMVGRGGQRPDEPVDLLRSDRLKSMLLEAGSGKFWGKHGRGIGYDTASVPPVKGNFNPNLLLDISTTSLDPNYGIPRNWPTSPLHPDMPWFYEDIVDAGQLTEGEQRAYRQVAWPRQQRFKAIDPFAGLLAGTHDQGGWWDPNQLALNLTGQPELVLNPDQAGALMSAVDPNTTTHGTGNGVRPGPTADQIAGLAGPTRTEGYIPAGAGASGTAGTSFASGLYQMGAEAINGLIDQAASAAAGAASMGANAFAPGSGGAAAAGISMGTQAAKRAVQYGAQLAGIWTDAAAEILLPFGVPRLFNTDVTGFMPQFAPKAVGVTTAEKAENAQQGVQTGDPSQLPGGPVQPGQMPGAQPVGAPAAPAQPGGVAPGPTPAPMPGGGQPHLSPSSMGPGPLQPPPPQQQGPSDPLDFLTRLVPSGLFDTGGVLQPNSAAINKSRRPELVLNHQQWTDTAAALANAPVGELDPESSGGSYDFRTIIESVTVKDLDELEQRQNDFRRRQMKRYGGRPGR